MTFINEFVVPMFKVLWMLNVCTLFIGPAMLICYIGTKLGFIKIEE